MRISRTAAAMTAALLVASATLAGCTNQITGVATPDPNQPPLGLSDDGYGIVAGYPDAPVQIELYTEPQCTHCADLQAEYGDDIDRYINLGQLAVTYRPLTFLDDGYPDGHSAHVANAMFLAVGEPDANEADMASGPEFQRFVEDLWAHQDPGGLGPTDDDMAAMADDAGMPDDVVGRIGDGELAPTIDIEDMADYNHGTLAGRDPLTTRTPTVYDLSTEETVEVRESDWLDNLMSSA